MIVLKRFSQLALALVFATKFFVICAEAVSFSEFKTAAINGAVGNFSATNGVFTLKNSATNDGLFFVSQPFVGNGQIVAHLRGVELASAKVGVMFRQNLDSNSLSAGTFLSGSNILFERHSDLKKSSTQTTRTNETSQWVRVVRDGNAFSGFFSNDGTNWIQFSADTIEMPNEIFAGLAISGIGEATVDRLRMSSGRLTNPVEGATFVAPIAIPLVIDLGNFGDTVRGVEFFADAREIGEAQKFPYRLEWTNALAGTHSLTAKITDDSGAEFFTEPVTCHVKLPAASAIFLREDSVTRGKWNEKYGKDGFYIIRHATNFSAYAEVSINAKNILLLWTDDPSALRLTNGVGGVASAWFSQTNLTMSVKVLDGNFHQIALYCQDWGGNERVQNIEAIDPATGVVLDSRRATQFHNGNYFVWSIRGVVRFRITALAGNAVLSGIFFDASPR